MAEKTSDSGRGKWAAEAYDFLRLHQRIGNRLYGLVLMQFAWVALLWLVTRLGPGQSAAQVRLPAVAPDAQGAWHLTTTAVNAADLFVPGAVVLSVVWLWRSGLLVFIVRPLGRLLRFVARPLVLVLFVVVAGLSLPLFLIAWPVERALARRWERRTGANDVAALRRTRDAAEYRALVRSRIRFRAERPLEAVAAGYGWAIRTLMPDLRIGIAHIESFSFDEEQAGARVPLQAFAEAASRLDERLDRLAPGLGIRIVVLPEAVRVRSTTAAARLRGLLGLDALLWGTFLAADPGKLWINVSTGRAGADARRPSSAELLSANGGALHPFQPRETPRRLLVDSQAPHDAYVALALAVARALSVRPSRWTAAFRWFDRFVVHGRELTTVVEGLLHDVAHGADRPMLSLTAEGIATANLVEWAKDQLRRSPYEDVSLAAIRRAARRGVAATPEDPDAQYLHAACCFADGEVADGQRAVDAGWQCDRHDRYAGWAYLASAAEMMIDDAAASSGERQVLQLGQAAVVATLAVHVDRDAAAAELARHILASTRHALAEAGHGDVSPAERYLYRLAGVAVPERPAGAGPAAAGSSRSETADAGAVEPA